MSTTKGSKGGVRKAPIKKRKSSGPKSLQLKVAVDTSYDAPSFYANYIEVAINPHEFGLFVCQVPSKFTPRNLEKAEKGEEVLLEPLLHLTLPPTVIPGLIEALKKQHTLYKKLQADSDKSKKRIKK